MRRHNIYLYEYNGELKGQKVGFCRMDIHNNAVKLLLNISVKEMGIASNKIVEIQGNILIEGGEKQEFNGDISFAFSGNFVKTVFAEKTEKIEGIELLCKRENGSYVQIIGMLENKVRVKQIELEDTVYNIDTNCIEEKCAENKSEIKKLSIMDVTSLPRECWRISKNKFILCGCNRYGYFVYTEREGKKIIGVPGKMNDNEAGCAKKYGFSSYVKSDFFGDEKEVDGYWVMNVNSNGK